LDRVLCGHRGAGALGGRGPGAQRGGAQEAAEGWADLPDWVLWWPQAILQEQAHQVDYVRTPSPPPGAPDTTTKSEKGTRRENNTN